MKIVLIDIETTNLRATDGLGFILCASMKVYGKSKIDTIRIDETPGYGKTMFLYDDSWVVRKIRDWFLSKNPDWVIHYNGKYFDMPYIDSRLLGLDEQPLPPFRQIDHWATSRYKLRLHSHSLATLAEHLKVKHRKTRYAPRVWQRAMFGHKPSMNSIVRHCEMDIRVLEECHRKVAPILRTLKGIY